MNWNKRFTIGKLYAGEGARCALIAEIGSNHDGSLERALELIESARDAGADAVKFQAFSAEGLAARRVCDKHGAWRDNPMFEALERVALPTEWLPDLTKRAHSLGVELLATPFDTERLELLLEHDAPGIKIASGDLTFDALLRKAGASGLPVLLSCGMSEEAEVAHALEVLWDSGARDLILLHCVSRYPPEDRELNLRALPRLAERFGIPVGLSDHSSGPTAALGAVALGAVAIEKHYTLDRSLPGPDHPFAMQPDEFADMARAVRRLEAMLGDGCWEISEAERGERIVGRRSIRAARALNEGASLREDDLKCVRPGGGVPPSRLDAFIGRRLTRAIREDESICESDLA